MKRTKFLAGLVIAVSLLAAAPAGAAVYPAGKSTFEGGTQGWTGSKGFCTLEQVGATCTAATGHAPDLGNPAGHIIVKLDITANALTLFKAAGMWTSPVFTLPAGRTPTGATLSYDRMFNPGGLINLGPIDFILVQLLDLTDSSITELRRETLTSADYSKWGTTTAGVNPSLLKAGHRYRLIIGNGFTTTLVAAGVIGAAHTRFDNVQLNVSDVPCCGITTTPGVTVVRGPVDDSWINQTLVGLSWDADFGTGPGGSAVPLDRCTIIGTPGADVIRGSTGNDVICGLGGRDRIAGRGGRDIIDGASGNDRLKGGSGRDVILSLRGNDRSSGGSARDRIGGGAGVDKLVGNGGDDRLSGGSSRDSLKGRRGEDRLRGGTGRDRLFGGLGRDRLFAKDGSPDRVLGGLGRDRGFADTGGALPDLVGGIEVLN